LAAQFGRVLVFVDFDRMIRGDVYEFVLGIGGDCDGAVALAGHLAAIDNFTSHWDPFPRSVDLEGTVHRLRTPPL
jgi:hypothetical protein